MAWVSFKAHFHGRHTQLPSQKPRAHGTLAGGSVLSPRIPGGSSGETVTGRGGREKAGLHPQTGRLPGISRLYHRPVFQSCTIADRHARWREGGTFFPAKRRHCSLPVSLREAGSVGGHRASCWATTPPGQAPPAPRPSNHSSVHKRTTEEQMLHSETANQPPPPRCLRLEPPLECPAALCPSGFQLDLRLVHLQSVIVPQELGLRDRAILLLLRFLHGALGHILRGVLRVLGGL